jgi:hypothetical protein
VRYDVMTLAEPHRTIAFFFSCQLLIPHIACCYGEEKILLFLREMDGDVKSLDDEWRFDT